MKLNRFFIFIISILLITGCKKGPVKHIEENKAMPVKVEIVKLKDMDRTLEYIGNIKAYDEAEVYPKVSGKLIEKVKEDGAIVNKGDVIAYIDRDEIGLQFEKAPVTSPLKGVVGRFYLDIGSNVTPQSVVALVIDMEKVQIDVNIPEKHVSDISLGKKADVYVDAYREEKFTGTITKISPVLDMDTRSMPVEITVENKDHRLKSGMFAKVLLIVEEHKQVPVVLKEALLGKEPNFYVYSVEKGKAGMKKVMPGIRQNGYVEIKEGLKENDSVVIMGQQKLQDGVDVKIEE